MRSELLQVFCAAILCISHDKIRTGNVKTTRLRVEDTVGGEKPVPNYITFTFSHLADAPIQSDLTELKLATNLRNNQHVLLFI